MAAAMDELSYGRLNGYIAPLDLRLLTNLKNSFDSKPRPKLRLRLASAII